MPKKEERFAVLFAKAETLAARAKYDEALATLDELEKLLPLDEDVHVTLAAPNGVYFSAAQYTEKTETHTVVEISDVEAALICADFRFRCLHNVGVDHPDADVRKDYSTRACKVARKCIEMMNVGGYSWYKKFGERWVLQCNELGWHAYLYVDDPKKLKKALADIEPAVKHIRDDYSREGAYIRDTKARLLLKLGEEDAAFRVVQDVLAHDRECPWFDDVVKTAAYESWASGPAGAAHALEDEIGGERFSADGKIAGGAFSGMWRTYDAKRRVRLEIDLTGEPCPDRAKLAKHLADALLARHVPSLKVPELAGVDDVKWTSLSGAGCPRADAKVPLYLRALASHEPLVRRRGVTGLAMSIDCDQGSVGEASAAAVRFFVALLEGKTADDVGRKYALAYLQGIVDNVASAEEPDAVFAKCEKALRTESRTLQRLRKSARGDLRELYDELTEALEET